MTFCNRVLQSGISRQPLFVHTSQHGHGYIGVVVHLHLALVLMEAMEAANVLLQSAFPRNRHHKEERVKSRVVKSLAEAASGGENYSRLSRGNGNQGFSQLPSLLRAHSAL